MAEESTQINAQVVHTEQGGGYASLSYLVDAAGTQYIACANSRFDNNNITFVDLYVVPAGQPIPLLPAYRIVPVNKIDNVALFNSGHDLIVTLESHTLGGVPGEPRPINIEQARINGLFATTPGYVAERGGEGVVIVPTQPNELPFTLQDILDGVSHIVGSTAEDSLVNKITAGHASVRTSLREIDKQALVYLMDTANYNDPNDPDHLAKKFQDEYYSYNANLQWGGLQKFGDQVGYKPPRSKVGQFIAKVTGKQP